MRRFDTLLTIAFAFVFAVGLSYAPIPNAFKPLPDLAAGGIDTAKELVFVSTSKKPKAIEGETLAPPPDEEPSSQAVEPDEEPSSAATTVVGMSGAVEAARGKKLDALAQQLGSVHVDIVESCHTFAELPVGAAPDSKRACKTYSLDPFFEALDAMEAKLRTSPVRVVHLGDSLIASDYISDVLRRRLEKRFGSGGRGYLFIDRPSRFSGLKTRTGEASGGWEVHKLPEPVAPDGIYGFSGVSFTAHAPQTSRFDGKGSKRADVYYLQHPSGGVVDVGGTKLDTKGDKEAKVATFPIDGGVTLQTKGHVRLFGVALENGTTGITLDSVGLPGATAAAYLKSDAAAFRSHLAFRDPSLVIIMLGGNEAFRLDNKWTSLADVKAEALALARRVRDATPNAACLVTSPLASGVATMGSQIRVRKETRAVADVIKEAALDAGCAYWDMLEAMGGEGAIVKWFDAGLMNADLVHPLRLGADVIGHLFESALARAYFIRHGPDALADPAGLIDVSQRGLHGVFKKLAKLEREKKGRVSIVQLGASHTAGHMFTDEARAVFQQRFGEAGRGFVAAGSPSARLKRAAVKRYLSPGWTVKDAMRSPPGAMWGLTGIAATARPGANMEMAFCDGGACSARAQVAPNRFDLFYLDGPEQGEIEVRVDGKKVAQLPRIAAKTPEVKVHTLQLKGAQHTLKLRNTGDAPITVYGVSQEIEQPGVIWDALGLPGSTAIVADGYDKVSFKAQLAERAADLYVLFYGTNESAMQRFDPQVYRQRYVSLLETLRAASPEADCLILGPTDRMAPDKDGVWREVMEMRTVISSLRNIAESQGCAFWSARAAMGGKESIGRWLNDELAHADHVHLSEKGYQALARKMTSELLDAYGAYLVYASAPESVTQAPNKKKTK